MPNPHLVCAMRDQVEGSARRLGQVRHEGCDVEAGNHGNHDVTYATQLTWLNGYLTVQNIQVYF